MTEMWTCPVCETENDVDGSSPIASRSPEVIRMATKAGFDWSFHLPICKYCGADNSDPEKATFDYVEKIQLERFSQSDDWDAVPAIVREKYEKIIITTTESIPGSTVTSIKDVLLAERVRAISWWTEWDIAAEDWFAKRSPTYENELRMARKASLAEMKIKAHGMGADAIIGVRFDFNEVSGDGRMMVFLVASGTAVTLRETGNQ